jgi:hypothetical protein
MLLDNPGCIYCGAPATTTDHCPPRCFFEGRQWPESYEFPACARCNDEARRDEQALAVLIRIKLSHDPKGRIDPEWERLVQGVRNNQPAVWAEWNALSGRVSQKRAMREILGVDGDPLRHAGWGLFNIGQLTQDTIQRFMIKLSKALYFQHTKTLFGGVIYVSHINGLSRDFTPDFITEILRMAPSLPILKRNNRSLTDQFIYRFNHSAEYGVMYAIVQFSEQFIFQLIALRSDMERRLTAMAQDELPLAGRYECSLKYTRASANI